MSSTGDTPGPETSPQDRSRPTGPVTVGEVLADIPVSTVPPSGGRKAFRDIRRQLSDDDLTSPGVQKLILDELERTETDCDALRGYVERYHEADKRAAILESRLVTQTALEILFAVGIAAGGILIGLAQPLWAQGALGQIVLGIGAILVVSSAVARIIRR